jgi:hypothetical protein
LVSIQAADSLSNLNGKVLIPPAVKAELAHANTPDIVHTRISRPPLWLEMMNLKNPVDLTLSYLDGGEQEAISLASELQASLLRIFLTELKGYFDEKLTLFQVHRALLNGCFCNNVEGSEHRDEARFEKRHREYQKQALDEVQVYRDVQAVEENRRLEGKVPRMRFLRGEERQSSEQQHPSSQGQSERRGESDHAQKI